MTGMAKNQTNGDQAKSSNAPYTQSAAPAARPQTSGSSASGQTQTGLGSPSFVPGMSTTQPMGTQSPATPTGNQSSTSSMSSDKPTSSMSDKSTSFKTGQSYTAPLGNQSSTSSTTDKSLTSSTSAQSPAAAIGNQAKEVASQVANQAKDLVSTRVSMQTEKSAGDLGDVAKALRETSRQLDGNMASPYVEKAADQIERVSQFLSTANPTEIVRGVESFARREPLLFLGGAFTAGLLFARFIKSTSHRDGQPGYDTDRSRSVDPFTTTLPGGYGPSYGKDRG